MQEREAKVWGKMKGFFGKLPTDVRRIVGLEGGSKGGLEVGRPEKKGWVASVEGTEGRRPDGKESFGGCPCGFFAKRRTCLWIYPALAGGEWKTCRKGERGTWLLLPSVAI